MGGDLLNDDDNCGNIRIIYIFAHLSAKMKAGPTL
jgi:hypothetical protein